MARVRLWTCHSQGYSSACTFVATAHPTPRVVAVTAPVASAAATADRTHGRLGVDGRAPAAVDGCRFFGDTVFFFAFFCSSPPFFSRATAGVSSAPDAAPPPDSAPSDSSSSSAEFVLLLLLPTKEESSSDEGNSARSARVHCTLERAGQGRRFQRHGVRRAGRATAVARAAGVGGADATSVIWILLVWERVSFPLPWGPARYRIFTRTLYPTASTADATTLCLIRVPRSARIC